MILPVIITEFLTEGDSLEYKKLNDFLNNEPMMVTNNNRIPIANISIVTKRSAPFSLKTLMKNWIAKTSPAIRISGFILFFQKT